VFSYPEPVKKPKDWSDVAGFGSFDSGVCKRVLDPIETVQLGFMEVVPVSPKKRH